MILTVFDNHHASVDYNQKDDTVILSNAGSDGMCLLYGEEIQPIIDVLTKINNERN